MNYRRILPVVLTGLTACEDPVDLESRAGSFDLANGCGAVSAAADGKIFTFSHASATTIRVDQRTPTGTLVWSATVPGSAFSSCIGYVDFSGNLLTAPTDTVYSLASATGSIRWKLPLNSAVLALGLGDIFAGTRGSNQQGAAVYSINPNTGAILWTRAVANQAVGVVVDGLQPNVYGIRRAGAIALRPTDGAVLWDAPFPGSRDGFSAAIASDGSIAVASDADFLGEIDYYAPNGTKKWTRSRATHLAAPPIIDHAGAIYTAWQPEGGLPAAIMALAPLDGSIVWSRSFDRIQSDIVVDADRTVFVIARATPDSAFQLYGIRDGNVVSAVAAPGVAIGTSAPLVLHQNKLIYYVANGRVVFTPTGGINPSAPWPMANRDAMRSNRRVPYFPPD